MVPGSLNHLWAESTAWSLKPPLLYLELESRLLYSTLSRKYWNHFYCNLIPIYFMTLGTTWTIPWAEPTLWTLEPPLNYLELNLLYGPWNHLYSTLSWIYCMVTRTTSNLPWAKSAVWSLEPPPLYLELNLLYGPWNHLYWACWALYFCSIAQKRCINAHRAHTVLQGKKIVKISYFI